MEKYGLEIRSISVWYKKEKQVDKPQVHKISAILSASLFSHIYI